MVAVWKLKRRQILNARLIKNGKGYLNELIYNIILKTYY